jgi:hypothetical protein
MDPLGSINAAVQLTSSIMSYLKDVQDAPQDRIDVLIEISVLNSLLVILHNRVQAAKYGDPWLATVRTLAIGNGPLDQFRSHLERVALKVTPVYGIHKIGKQLTWKFDKAEIKDILSRIERIKTFISLALANDLL